MEGGEEKLKVYVAEERHGKCIGIFLSGYYLKKILNWKYINIIEFKSLEAAKVFLWDKFEDSKFDLKKLEYNRFLFYEGYEPEKNKYYENIEIVYKKPIWTGKLFEKGEEKL